MCKNINKLKYIEFPKLWACTQRKLADVEINYNLESVVVVNKNNKGEVRKATTYKIKLS